MKTRRLGKSGPNVSAIGLGCMGMSEFYGPRDDEQSRATLARALDRGVTFFDTADTYGYGHNEELVGGFLAGGTLDTITIATKFGIVRREGTYERRIDNSPTYIRAACDASLRRLGVEAIGLYYVHRIETGRPIEETVGVLADLVKAGKVRAIGLCEASTETLRRASAVHPITALQTEYSLWTRFVEAEVLLTCRQLGIGFVPYAPLGRGFLTGAIPDRESLATGDIRRSLPRFEPGAMAQNMSLADRLAVLSKAKGASPAQIALAWLLAQGPDIVPIPGTKRLRYLEENTNAANVQLTTEDLAEIQAAALSIPVQGERYSPEGMKGIEA